MLTRWELDAEWSQPGEPERYAGVFQCVAETADEAKAITAEGLSHRGALDIDVWHVYALWAVRMSRAVPQPSRAV